MRIHIDQDECIECGLCASTCPDVFEQNEGQKASIVKCYQLGGASDGEVGEPLQKCADEASAPYPVEAIDTGD
jgi:ferredoxin